VFCASSTVVCKKLLAGKVFLDVLAAFFFQPVISFSVKQTKLFSSTIKNSSRFPKNKKHFHE